jgi:hypothetical protein
VVAGDDDDDAGGAGGGGTSDPGDDGAASGGRGTGGGGGGVPEAATFATLADHANRMVRVGGRLERAEGVRLHLHDGTASGIVRLPDDSTEFVAGLLPGEVVNVTGRVRQREDEPPEVVARSLADIQRAASLPDAIDDPARSPLGETEMLAAGPDALEAPVSELDAALVRSAARSEIPLPILAMLAAGLVSAVIAIAGGTAFLLWRRRAAAGELMSSRPASMWR